MQNAFCRRLTDNAAKKDQTHRVGLLLSCRISLVRLSENFNGMKRLNGSAVMNLHATRATIADDFVEVVLFDALEKFFADFHRDLILLLAETVIAGNATATGVRQLNFRADFLQNVLRGQPDCLRLQMARHVIQKSLIERLEIGIEFAALLKNFQKLKGVVNVGGRLMEFFFAKKFVILFLEHERTTCARRDDRNALALPIQNPRDVVVCISVSFVKKTGDDQRRTAAFELRIDDDFVAVRVEDFDESFANLWLVVVDVAAHEHDDFFR